MTTLYEISTNFQSLLNTLNDVEEMNEEAQQQLIAEFAQVQGSFHEKAVNTVKVIKNFENEVDAIDAEIKRLMARKKARQAKADWLKQGLKGAMIATNHDKIESPFFTISLSKETVGGVVFAEDFDVNTLPDEYKKTKVVVEADKNALKDDLKEGVYIEGVELEMVRKLTIR